MKPLYGLTHCDDGTPILRQPTSVKVGIGLPKGPAVHVWIKPNGKWAMACGVKTEKSGPEITEYDTKAAVRSAYEAALKTVPERKYPSRLAHFTFTQVSPTGEYRYDLDEIEKHGPVPTEVPIMFVKDDPFDREYAYFTALEKKCWGDGRSATRVVTLWTDDDQRLVAEAASGRGERFYQIEESCWTRGCPLAGNGCKPHGRLFFQLMKSPRLGSTAYFDTTGRRSTGWLFTCLYNFREFTGRGDAEAGFVAGIPLVLVMRPYRTQYKDNDGRQRTSMQNGVFLDFQATDDPTRMVQLLVQAGVDYRIATTAPLKMLQPPVDITELTEVTDEAAVSAVPEDESEEVFVPETPTALINEFYVESSDGSEDTEIFDPNAAPRGLEGPVRKPKTAGARRSKKKAAAAPAEEPAASEPEPHLTPAQLRVRIDECVEAWVQRGLGNVFPVIEGAAKVKVNGSVKNIPDSSLEAVLRALTDGLKT